MVDRRPAPCRAIGRTRRPRLPRGESSTTRIRPIHATAVPPPRARRPARCGPLARAPGLVPAGDRVPRGTDAGRPERPCAGRRGRGPRHHARDALQGRRHRHRRHGRRDGSLPRCLPRARPSQPGLQRQALHRRLRARHAARRSSLRDDAQRGKQGERRRRLSRPPRLRRPLAPLPGRPCGRWPRSCEGAGRSGRLKGDIVVDQRFFDEETTPPAFLTKSRTSGPPSARR